jgi:hypothetical protein
MDRIRFAQKGVGINIPGLIGRPILPRHRGGMGKGSRNIPIGLSGNSTEPGPLRIFVVDEVEIGFGNLD